MPRSPSAEPAATPVEVLEAATRILGRPVEAGDVAPLEGRASVLTVTRPGEPDAVLKWVVPGAGRPVLEDRAATQFLTGLGLDPPVSARFLGGEPGIFAMERLADGPSLASLLLGHDAGAARRGLVGFARALGRLHAATAERTDEYRRLRESLGPLPDRGFEHHAAAGLARWAAALPRLCAELGLAVPAGLGGDIDEIGMALSRPGPFEVLLHGDPCPDNTRVLGDHVVLFDFEHAAPGHALLDGAYPQVPFPTCWCVAALDDADAAAMEAAYRSELAGISPETADDVRWKREAAHAAGAWLVDMLAHLPEEALAADVRWGTATLRQRLLHRPGRFVALAERAGVLPALTELAADVTRVLRRRWADLAPLPAYPALAGPGEPAVERPEWWPR